jgi:hypothetical protein
MTHTRFAFVKANWHADIVGKALKGFIEIIPTQQVDVFDVPGPSSCRSWRETWRIRANMPQLWPQRLSSMVESIGMTSWRLQS